jgi:hypothetical protein
MWELFRERHIAGLFASSDSDTFDERALSLFHMQATHNSVYSRYLSLLNVSADSIQSVGQIPFLPVEVFKKHQVATGAFEPALLFTSSGTSGMEHSTHFLRDTALYTHSFLAAFERVYGAPERWCILGLLPSYLERSGSSLVFMVNDLILRSGHPHSGFYLHDHDKLRNTLEENERSGQPTILFGVTFGLLDFAENHQLPLTHTLLIETGGMKGRREELTREQVHEKLRVAFGAQATIHSEYGMTELLSQAYSDNKGIFTGPPWMRVLLRDPTDPLLTKTTGGRGALNIIDLANVDSCAFLAVSDLGEVYEDGRFTVTGRFDQAEVRGCSLMIS